MHTFFTPWKNQKTCFQGLEKGWIGNKWVKSCESQEKFLQHRDENNKV